MRVILPELFRAHQYFGRPGRQGDGVSVVQGAVFSAGAVHWRQRHAGLDQVVHPRAGAARGVFDCVVRAAAFKQ